MYYCLKVKETDEVIYDSFSEASFVEHVTNLCWSKMGFDLDKYLTSPYFSDICFMAEVLKELDKPVEQMKVKDRFIALFANVHLIGFKITFELT